MRGIPGLLPAAPLQKGGAVRVDRGEVMLLVASYTDGVQVELRVRNEPVIGTRRFSPQEWADLLSAVKVVGRAFNLG